MDAWVCGLRVLSRTLRNPRWAAENSQLDTNFPWRNCRMAIAIPELMQESTNNNVGDGRPRAGKPGSWQPMNFTPSCGVFWRRTVRLRGWESSSHTLPHTNIPLKPTKPGRPWVRVSRGVAIDAGSQIAVESLHGSRVITVVRPVYAPKEGEPFCVYRIPQSVVGHRGGGGAGPCQRLRVHGVGEVWECTSNNLYSTQ